MTVRRSVSRLVAVLCLVVIFPGSTLLPPSAYAGNSIDIYGMAVQSIATGKPVPSGQLTYPGGGLGLNLRIIKLIDFQVAGDYFPMGLMYGTTVQTLTTVQGRAGFRFNFGRRLFINIGGIYRGYFANALGLYLNEMGAYGGIGFKIPLGKQMALFINPMYNYSLSPQTYQKYNSVTTDVFLGLVGLTINFSTKR